MNVEYRVKPHVRNGLVKLPDPEYYRCQCGEDDGHLKQELNDIVVPFGRIPSGQCPILSLRIKYC